MWGKFLPAGGLAGALATALAGALLVACGGDADFVPIEAQPKPGLPMPPAVEGPFPVTRVVDGDTGDRGHDLGNGGDAHAQALCCNRDGSSEALGVARRECSISQGAEF